MKKFLLLISLFLFASTYSYAQGWVGVKSDSPTTIKKSLISSTENEIIVEVKVDGYFAREVNTPNGTQLVISAKDMASMLKKGAPDLPMYPIPMIIGDKAEMSVSVIESEYTDIQGVEVAPSKGNFSRQINPNDMPYEYGDMYQQDAFYPSSQASLEAPYILRDFRGQNMIVYPYAYNPVTKTLRVYTHLVIAAKKISDNGENKKLTRRSNNIILDPEHAQSYEHRFINYSSQSKYDFIVDQGEMLVVCVDEYMEALQPFVDWKNISGRPTTMVPVSETGTEDDLKAYMQDYYAQHPNLTYLLLVGEHNNLKSHYVPGGRSDNFYGMLEGNDYYEEILVGRLPVKDLEDANVQVGKILFYEREMDETATWATRAVGIGADEGSGHYGEPDYVHMDYIRDTLMNYTYTEVSQHYLYVNNPTANGMMADFNEGATLTNYCNHGEPTGWWVGHFSNSHVHQLTNDNKLSFIWSVACNNGQFDYEECFGEAWMRATNPSTGAYTGAVGGMFSWISQPWLPPMYGQDEMNAILTEWRDGYKHTLGGVSLNGNQFVLDKAPEDAGQTHNTWLLFGDPSMMVRTDVPQQMSVTCNPATLLMGANTLTVNADADYGIVTLSMNNEVIGSAYMEGGVAEINFEPLDVLGTAQLVVLAYNKVTTIMDIEIVSADGSYVIYDTYSYDDANGQLDYGENITLNIDVKNVGVLAANNVTVELSSESEYVTINNSTASIANIAPDEVYSISDIFNIDVAVDVPDGTMIDFDLSCSDGTDTWESSFSIKAHAPELVVHNVSMSDIEVLPGETSSLIFEITNEGSSPAYNVMTEVFSSSSDIIFSNNVVTAEVIEAGSTANVTLEFTSASSVENGSVFEIAYMVAAGYYTYNSTYDLIIGSIMETFETGDFSMYPWTFSGNEWTINTNAYQGSYSAKSAAISHGQSTSMLVTVDVLADGEISFYAFVSSEESFDKLHFLIDGVNKLNLSGSVNWALQTVPVTQGVHTFEWKYSKDSSASNGEDCARIDNISFPPVSTISLLEPIMELKAEVTERTVVLDWSPVETAEEYLVRRNGQLLGAVAELSFTDEVPNDGVYTYSVVARNGFNYSAPAFVTVSVGTVDVVEIEDNTIAVYPNPTSGIINVDVNGVYDAIIYNYQGQIVMKVNNNNGQIDMSGLTSGIYFIEIRTDDFVAVEKIIVK